MGETHSHASLWGDQSVVASVDGASSQFVIADISQDERWLAIEQDDAPILEEWI